MGLSMARKLLVVLVVTCVFSGTADAWSWSWGSGQSGSRWGWGWGSDNSGSSSGSGGSSFTNWGWGRTSGSNHSSGTGSTHKSHHNHTAPSNNSSGTGSTHNNNTAPSNHSTATGSTSDHNHTAPLILQSRKIEVTVWKNGFDYQEWVSKNAPFYIYDVLIFKYNNNQTLSKNHNNKNNKNDVYLLQDLRSYRRCDVTRGMKLEARRHFWSSSLGGFKLLLRKTQPYYFASGDHNDCNHNMKFFLSPIPPPCHTPNPQIDFAC